MATDRYDAIVAGARYADSPARMHRARRGRSYAFDFGPLTLRGSAMADGTRVAYASRRTELHKLLADASDEAIAEARDGFTFIDDQTFSHRRVAVRGVRQKVADSLSTTGYLVTA